MPQAPGRIERCFSTLLDRRVKELRPAGISDIDSAHRFLRERFLDDFKARFAVRPPCAHDAHRPAEGFDLDAICSEQEPRTVVNDFTIRLRNIRYQPARAWRRACAAARCWSRCASTSRYTRVSASAT